LQPGEDGTAPLAGLRALDVTGELGWLVGKILADVGTEVLKIDPPGGDPGRKRLPLVEGPHAQASAAWIAFNAGKRRLDLDLASKEGRERFLDLAESADFVIESEAPGRLQQLGIGWPQLSARNPALVMTSVTLVRRGFDFTAVGVGTCVL